MRPVVLALAAVLTPLVATAQPQPEPTLPPVVVEGRRVPDERTRTDTEAREEMRRVPGGTEVVDQQKIEQSRAANLKDALDFVPGVFVQPRFGAADESQISIRGSGLRNNFHLRGLNILIDGFPYGNADGFADFESLELLATKRLEVYKGANALRFGGYTLGGAINLVGKTGYGTPLIELRSSAGTFGFLKNYDLKFAVATDGRRFGPPKRLHTSATSIPDQARMAVDPAGRAVIVWEESTAVRRRVLLRYTLDAGRTLSPIRVLSTAIKAYAPDITLAPDGSFLVAWHDEQSPFLKTVVQPVRLPKAR
jgi:TonB-dependent Receptor Plug Domain